MVGYLLFDQCSEAKVPSAVNVQIQVCVVNTETVVFLTPPIQMLCIRVCKNNLQLLANQFSLCFIFQLIHTLGHLN